MSLRWAHSTVRFPHHENLAAPVHYNGGDSDQKSRGKGRQLATSALKYVNLLNDIKVIQQKF